MDFEWDPEKAESNLRKHRVPFEKAAQIFLDPARIDDPEEASLEYGEDRWIVIGHVEDAILTVVYTHRDSRIRIISARRSTNEERQLYWTSFLST